MKKVIVFAVLFFLVGLQLNAQCSDAGVCSLGGHDSMEEESRFSFSAGYSYGYSGKDDDIKFNSFSLSGSLNIDNNNRIALMIPYNSQSGPLGDVSGIGDMIISYTHDLHFDESILSLSLGGKIATADVNQEPLLPLAYQSGLGSNDILFGVNYLFNGFIFGAGYQLAGGRSSDSITKLERGDDLLIRGGYSFQLDKFLLKPQLLFIKRLSKSTIAAKPVLMGNNGYIEVDGSDHSQLNFLADVNYELTEELFLNLQAAIPFLKRDVNLDGLKRAYTFSFSTSYIF